MARMFFFLCFIFVSVTASFAMDEQAKGSIDAANTGNHYMVLNKHCKFVKQSAVKKHSEFLVRIASEFIDRYPSYAMIGHNANVAIDKYLSKAPAKERQGICRRFRAEVIEWVEFNDGEGEEDDG